MKYLLMVCGVYWIIFSLTQHTRNFKSSFVYKVIPFFTGILVCLCSMDMFGWINIF